MELARRLLVVCAICFWQGGATFYAGVVIPIGAKVQGSHRKQAVITRQVTQVLHIVGGIAMVPLLWDVLAGSKGHPGRRRWRLGLWLGLVLTLVGQVVVHGMLDRRFDPERLSVSDQPVFYLDHRIYIWLSMAQLAICLTWLGLTLAGWREENREAISTGQTG